MGVIIGALLTAIVLYGFMPKAANKTQQTVEDYIVQVCTERDCTQESSDRPAETEQIEEAGED